MELNTGMHVQVRTDEGTGRFVGKVVSVDEHQAQIRPDSKDVRGFIGDEHYVLGSAHWDSRVTVVSAADIEAAPRVQIVHSRHPDLECGHTVFVDDVRWTAEIEDIDPGRGWTRADWNERIHAWDGDETNFGQAVQSELEQSSDNEYITD
jgi:hypothetical protein